MARSHSDEPNLGCGIENAKAGVSHRVPNRAPNSANLTPPRRSQRTEIRPNKHKIPANDAFQNRQAVAAPRLEGSIPSPLRCRHGHDAVEFYTPATPSSAHVSCPSAPG